MDKRHLTLTCDAELMDWLSHESVRTGISRSQLVRGLVRAALNAGLDPVSDYGRSTDRRIANAVTTATNP